MEGEEFTSISESKLIEIISSDDLAVDREETVFISEIIAGEEFTSGSLSLLSL